MKEAIQRNAALILGTALAGTACIYAAPAMISIRGTLGPTILSAHAPAKAALAVAIALAVSILVAVAVARVVNSAVGLFVLGGGLALLAMRLSTFREIAFAATATSPRAALLMLALETALWAIAILLATIIVFRFGGHLSDIEPLKPGVPVHPIFSRDALTGAAAGLAMLPIVWIIAQSPAKGQMLAATFLGGLIAGLLGRLLAPNVQPVLIFASAILFGALGHVIAAFMAKGPLDAAFAGGKLPNLALAMPIDYAAGSLLGVSMGLGWAKSFLHHEPDPHAVPAAGAA